MELVESLIGWEVTVGQGSECLLTFVRGLLHIADKIAFLLSMMNVTVTCIYSALKYYAVFQLTRPSPFHCADPTNFIGTPGKARSLIQVFTFTMSRAIPTK